MSTLFEEINRIDNAKQNIRSAIEEKGGSVSGLIDNYAQAIRDLPSGGGSNEVYGIITYSSSAPEGPYQSYVISTEADYNVLINLSQYNTNPLNFSDGTSIARAAIVAFEWGPAAEGLTTTLPTFAGFSNLTYLGKFPTGPTYAPASFLHSLQNLNCPLILPSTLTECYSQTITSLGSFDKELDLSNTSLLYLPNGFMSYCANFSRAIILPKTLEIDQYNGLGENWLTNTNNFTGPFVVGNLPAPQAAAPGGSNYDNQRNSFATTDPNSLMYTQGVTFRGENAAAWKAVFDDYVGIRYRKTIADTRPWPNW